MREVLVVSQPGFSTQEAACNREVKIFPRGKGAHIPCAPPPSPSIVCVAEGGGEFVSPNYFDREIAGKRWK